MFYIEAQENALIETKLMYERKINNLEMTLADIESKVNNYRMTQDEIEDILENAPRIVTMQDASRRIAKLESCLRSQIELMKNGKREANEMAIELK